MTRIDRIDLHDPQWWHGAIDLEPFPGGGARAWRIPHQDPRFDIGLSFTGTPAGVRISMTTSATRIELQLRLDEPEPCPVDVVVDGVLHRRLPAATAGTEPLVADLPGTLVTVDIWLPQFGCSGVERLELTSPAEAAAPRPVDPRSRRWTAYGSSITMCAQADGPTTAWPSRVATALDLELTNVAYAGQCLLDPPVARLIADHPADLITLCLGINVHGQSSHTARSLLPAVIGFIETVRDGHPGTPIAVISPIAVRAAREDRPSATGLRVSQIRDIVHDAHDRIVRATGDPDLHLIDGRDLLGDDDLELLIDEVHPSDDGCALLAERMANHLARW